MLVPRDVVHPEQHSGESNAAKQTEEQGGNEVRKEGLLEDEKTMQVSLGDHDATPKIGITSYGSARNVNRLGTMTLYHRE